MGTLVVCFDLHVLMCTCSFLWNHGHANMLDRNLITCTQGKSTLAMWFLFRSLTGTMLQSGHEADKESHISAGPLCFPMIGWQHCQKHRRSDQNNCHTYISHTFVLGTASYEQLAKHPQSIERFRSWVKCKLCVGMCSLNHPGCPHNELESRCGNSCTPPPGVRCCVQGRRRVDSQLLGT